MKTYDQLVEGILGDLVKDAIANPKKYKAQSAESKGKGVILTFKNPADKDMGFAKVKRAGARGADLSSPSNKELGINAR